MNIVRQVVILSAEKNELTPEVNAVRTATLESVLELRNCSYVTADGVYKNSKEKCFVVMVDSQQDIEDLKSLAFLKFGQESVLVQDSNQIAKLEFRDGKKVELGKLKQTNKENAENRDAYTFVDGKYYITTR